MKLMSELDPQALIEHYLSEALIMQLATSRDEQPWICSLHFVADDQSNLYWISKKTRRHSEDIEMNQKVAIAIAVKTEKPLVGIQAEGSAEVVSDTEIARTIMDRYIEHHGSDKAFVDTIVAGINEHVVYVFHPKRFSLFDQDHFPDQPSQEWVIAS